jgi:hypothetical protein
MRDPIGFLTAPGLVFALSCALPARPIMADWSPVNGPYGMHFREIASNGTVLYAATQKEIYRSPDKGATWSDVTRGSILPQSGEWQPLSLAAHGRYAYLGFNRGVARFDDITGTWTRSIAGMADTLVTCLALGGDTVWAGTQGGGVFRSADQGAHWIRMNGSMTTEPIKSLAAAGDTLFAAGAGGLFRSADKGATWLPSANGMPDAVAKAVAANGAYVYALMDSGLFRSADRGGAWKRIAPLRPDLYLNTLSVMGAIVLCNSEWLLYRSKDDGEAWIEDKVSFTVHSGTSDVERFAASGTDLFGVGPWGIKRSSDGGDTWVPVNTGISGDAVFSMLTLANGDLLTARGEMYSSPDTGKTWKPVPGIGDSLNGDVTAFFGSDGSIFYGTYSGVYRSMDQGLTAKQYGGDWHRASGTAFIKHGGDIFIAAGPDRVLRIQSNGDTLVDAARGLEPLAWTHILAECDGILFAGTEKGIYRFSDSLQMWSQAEVAPLAKYDERPLAGMGKLLLAGGYAGGIYRSVDLGAAWTNIHHASVDSSVNLFAVYGGALVAGTGRGVALSTDSGRTWKSLNTGTFRPDVRSLHIHGGYLWAGTLDQGLWKRKLSELDLIPLGFQAGDRPQGRRRLRGKAGVRFREQSGSMRFFRDGPLYDAKDNAQDKIQAEAEDGFDAAGRSLPVPSGGVKAVR